MARPGTAPTCELGRRLDANRQGRGLTVEAMASLLGVAKPTYNAWLRGTYPEIINLHSIALVLDVGPGDVLEWVAPVSTMRAMGRLLNSRPTPVAAAA